MSVSAEMEISSSDALCAHCFDCLVMHFASGRMPPPPPPYDSCGAECPMFVTLHKSTRQGLQLRGCIGVLAPVPIVLINDYVYKSAFEDTRFPPLQADEVVALEITFSVLTRFEPTSGPNGHLDWELETHGIRINFEAGGRRFSATYLPGVAQEQGWSKEETLESLVRKAGYRGEWGWEGGRE
jgi:uncharacterized protein (TIGR00296 family)